MILVDAETAKTIGSVAYTLSLLIGLTLAAYYGSEPRWPQ